MGPEIKFVVFASLSVICFVLGYGSRVRGWIEEDVSRKIHFFTVVVLWSSLSFFGIWKGGVPQLNHGWVLVVQPVSMLLLMGMSWPLAKWIGCDKPRQGVMMVCGALCNSGSTMGSFLCYVWLAEDRDRAFGVGIEYVTVMSFACVLLIYPLARKFSPVEASEESVPRLMFKSLGDIRSLSMYTAVAGVILASLEVPVPGILAGEWLTLLLIFGACVGGYFAIGMRIRLGDGLEHLKHHGVLALVRFIVAPLVTLLLLWLIGFAPHQPDRLMMTVYMILSIMPTAILSVAVANLFHLDARMAASLWFWNTVIFLIFVLPVLWFVV